MKKFKRVAGIALCAIATFALGSCTNELSDLSADNTGANGFKLAKTADVIAWSGNHILSNSDIVTRGSNMNANMWGETWDCPPRPAEDLTPEELAELKELLSKREETHNTIVLPFENYYVQQIYKGENSYNAVDKDSNITNTSEVGSNKMEHLKAMGTYGYEHIENFNYGTNNNYPGECGCGKVHYKTTLKTGMPTSGIEPNEQFGFDETWGTNPKFYNNYLIVEYKGYYYVGFDYEAHTDRNNPGEAREFNRDWNFTDWIVRITPAYYKGTTPENNPGGVPSVPSENPNPDDKCENCEHPKHPEGNCQQEGGCGVEQCTPCPDCSHKRHPGGYCQEKGCEAEECTPCPKCPHKRHKPGACPEDDCTVPECHLEVIFPENPDPEFSQFENCPLCNHKMTYDAKSGQYVHSYDSSEIGEKCGKCESEERESLCSNEELDKKMKDLLGEGNKPQTTPSAGHPSSEVEVNLSINDQHEKYSGINDLVAKLSIHVRMGGDVEVFIPISEEYYCHNDDLVILNDHEKGHFNHGGPESVSYNVGGETITLTLHYEEDCIRVTTDGINQDVFDYCVQNYGDGINFEIWLYMNDHVTLKKETLQNWLNQSTIKFLDGYPDYYINAFNEDKTGAQFEWDCLVNITNNENQNNLFEDPVVEYHLNGSRYNRIYKNSSKNNLPDGLHDHKFLWPQTSR